MRMFKRAEPHRPQIQSAVKFPVEPRVKLSESARQVLWAFELLPDEHRPSYDVHAILQALDFKYGVDQASSHLRIYAYFAGEVETSYANLASCTCVVEYDDEGDQDFSNNSDGLTGRACPMPEYLQLYTAAREIKYALQERERAIADQVRAAELAGLEFQLRSVDDLTVALRAERDLIREVTGEIFVPAPTLAKNH